MQNAIAGERAQGKIQHRIIIHINWSMKEEKGRRGVQAMVKNNVCCDDNKNIEIVHRN